MINLRREILRGLPVDVSAEQRAALERQVFELDGRVFAGRGRRMNRFMLGADPEFVFASEGSAIYATTLGLRPGLAFGSDQNDRLVELRPHPSRSALEVVASTLSELRWLYRVYGGSRNVDWLAGAFQFNDGLGGHVHFGRKQAKLRDQEVAGLDGLARTMKAAGIFPTREWDRRCKGDAHGQRYGLYGDIRLQKHGYEYRTLPSWLESPWLAMLVLTLSKLVIIDPEITNTWMGEKDTAWARLCGLAKHYRGRDDDAWLLSYLMHNRAAFEWVGGDFKPRWGLAGAATNGGVQVFPQSIAPTAEDTGDLLALFTKGTPLPMREVQPNFRSQIPDDYRWILPEITPNRRPGVGDLIPDLVTGRLGLPRVQFAFDEGGSLTIVTPAGADTSKWVLPKQPLLGSPRVVVGEGSAYKVCVNREWRKGAAMADLRRFLLSGALPLWTIDDVQADSISKWQASNPALIDKFNLRQLLAA